MSLLTQVYAAEAKPVEDFYRRSGLLLDFEITGGIPETLPRLMAALSPAAGIPADKLVAAASAK